MIIVSFAERDLQLKASYASSAVYLAPRVTVVTGNESCHIWESHVTHEWVMFDVNVSCRTSMRSARGSSHVTSHHVLFFWGLSHAPCPTRESCHIWIRRVTYECGISHMNKSCHIWLSHSYVTWLTPPVSYSRTTRIIPNKSRYMRRGEREGVENKNTQNKRFCLNKQKLGEP